MTDRETYRKEELARIAADYGAVGGGDDYDPHQFRDVPHGTNFGETLMHVLKASLGTGILAMPQAFKHSGLINGFIFTFFITGICLYGIHILIRSQYKLCKRLKIPYITYPVAMRVALLSGPMFLTRFAYTSQIMVDTFLIVYQVGCCCVYVIFVAENVKKLADYGFSIDYPVEWYIMMTFIPFLLILFVPNMKWLAPFSMLSNLLTFVTCGILLQYIFSGLPSFGEMSYFGPAQDFPLFVGIVLFAIAAMGVITVVEKNMKTPSQFGAPCGILNISMVIIALSYAFMGFFGYWRHPHDIQPSITLNLDEDDVKAKIIQVLYAVAIYISYGLNGMVPVDIIWHNYLIHTFKDSPHPLRWEYLIRFLVVVCTFVFALSIPLLGEVIALCGALCMSCLEVVFPAMIHLCVRWPDNLGRGYWVLISDIIMVILGLLGCFSGTFSSVRDIAIKLNKRSSICRDQC